MNLSDKDQHFVSSIYSRYAAGTLKIGKTIWFDFPKKGWERFLFRLRAFFVRFHVKSTKIKALDDLCQSALSKVPKVVMVSKPEAYVRRRILYCKDDLQVMSSDFIFMVISRDAFFVSSVAKQLVILHELAHFTGFDLQRKEVLLSYCPEQEKEPWVKQEYLVNYCKEEITAEMTALLILRQFKALDLICYNETVLEAGMNYINKYLLMLKRIDPMSHQSTLDILSHCLMNAKRARRKIIQMAA
jgi:hypothetical protein